MKNRDFERERQGRQTENDSDWDWYYYEYRYLPYGSARGNRDFNRVNDDDRETERGRYGDREFYRREGDYESRSDPYSNDWTQGPYSGVGPRGYRRADDRIRDDVNDRLMWHGYVDATDIQVDVSDGVVTLSGTVNTRRVKRMAEDAAESVAGVEDVNNQIQIRQSNRSSSEGSMYRQIRAGMEVIGRDGENIGEVKEVRSNDFLVDRSMARDVYIPLNACQMTNGQIRLNIRADDVDDQDWEMPDLLAPDMTPKAQTRR